MGSWSLFLQDLVICSRSFGNIFSFHFDCHFNWSLESHCKSSYLQDEDQNIQDHYVPDLGHLIPPQSALALRVQSEGTWGRICEYFQEFSISFSRTFQFFFPKCCMETWSDADSESLYFIIVNLIICYIGPIIVLAICYSIILKRILKQKTLHQNSKEAFQRNKIKVIPDFS